jgi:glutamine synthetase
MKLDSEMEFHKFHKVESGKKIEELEKAKEEAVAELYRQKEAVFKLDKEIGNYDTKIFKLQTELDNAERDKANLADNLQIYKEKVAEL